MRDANQNDINTINQFFKKQDFVSEGKSKEEIDREMEKLKVEIDSLEDVNSNH